jgi:DNA polymerase III delta prime subunit
MDFKPTKAEKLAMLPIFFKRVTTVLKNEGIEFDKKTVLELTNKKFPDFRRCLNDLQKYSMGGSIDSGILLDMAGQDYDGLFDSLKNKRYSDMRKWVAEHTDNESTHIFRTVYDKANDKVDSRGIPSLVLLLGTYMYRASLVADQEVNLAAFFTEVMTDPNIVWK